MFVPVVSVIGGGAWGRALAYAFSQKNNVGIVSRRKLDNLKQINFDIKQIDIKDSLKCKYIVIAIKSSVIREWLEIHKLNKESILLVASKGVEVDSGSFICNIFSEYYRDINIGYLMGPSFAREVLEGMPCALNIHTKFNIDSIANIFPNFIKIYFDDDVIGGEIAGAYKNIIAIAGGLCDGLLLGNNAKASMIAKGLLEMSKFGMHFGAKESTFIGLSGAGDLFLTANSILSRNYRVGIELAKNKTIDSILKTLGEVAEGVFATRAVINLAKKYKIYVPIATEVYEVLNGKNPKDSIYKLL